jgi:hypothetical protein
MGLGSGSSEPGTRVSHHSCLYTHP